MIVFYVVCIRLIIIAVFMVSNLLISRPSSIIIIVRIILYIRIIIHLIIRILVDFCRPAMLDRRACP